MSQITQIHAITFFSTTELADGTLQFNYGPDPLLVYYGACYDAPAPATPPVTIWVPYVPPMPPVPPHGVPEPATLLLAGLVLWFIWRRKR